MGNQIVIASTVEVTREVDGIEMGVLSDGTAYLTGRGVARLCGAVVSTIINQKDEWSGGKRNNRFAKMLQAQGFDEPDLFMRPFAPACPMRPAPTISTGSLPALRRWTSRGKTFILPVTKPMPEVPKLDHVATLKLSAAQLRRCKAAAKAQGMRFSVWARTVLVDQANKIVGHNGSSLLDAPILPE